jgi:hypothetical protein
MPRAIISRVTCIDEAFAVGREPSTRINQRFSSQISAGRVRGLGPAIKVDDWQALRLVGVSRAIRSEAAAGVAACVTVVVRPGYERPLLGLSPTALEAARVSLQGTPETVVNLPHPAEGGQLRSPTATGWLSDYGPFAARKPPATTSENRIGRTATGRLFRGHQVPRQS